MEQPQTVTTCQEVGTQRRLDGRPRPSQIPDIGGVGIVAPAVAEPIVGGVEDVVGDEVVDGWAHARCFGRTGAVLPLTYLAIQRMVHR